MKQKLANWFSPDNWFLYDKNVDLNLRKFSQRIYFAIIAPSKFFSCYFTIPQEEQVYNLRPKIG